MISDLNRLCWQTISMRKETSGEAQINFSKYDLPLFGARHEN